MEILVLNFDTYSKYFSGEEYGYKSVNGEEKKISLNLLKQLLSNDLYKYFLKIITINQAYLKFGYAKNGDIAGTISISLTDAFLLINKNKDNLSTKELKRLEAIENSLSYNEFVRRHNGEGKTYKVGNKSVPISYKQIMNLLVNYSLLNNCQDYDYFGLTKKELFMVVKQFVEENDILQKCYLPEDNLAFINDLRNYKILDFESVEYINHNKNTNLLNITINQEIKENIFKDLNKEYTDLEKSIYIYIKLCKLFSYDEQFYLEGQRGESSKIHRELSRVAKIKIGDKIVCYEFNLIYAKLLEEIGIKAYLNSKVSGYGNGHANLEYVCDEQIVLADSTTSILDGDLINAKLGLELKGLVVRNKERQSRNKFNKALKKVYKDIENESEEMEAKLSFELIRDIYKKMITYKEKLPYEQRVSVLIEELNKSSLEGVDFLGYFLSVSKIIFNDEQRHKNISGTILKDNTNKDSSPCIIIAINDDNLNEKKSKNRYLYYRIKEGVKEISKYELEMLINKGVLEYINTSSNTIPGIVKGKGRK